MKKKTIKRQPKSKYVLETLRANGSYDVLQFVELGVFVGVLLEIVKDTEVIHFCVYEYGAAKRKGVISFSGKNLIKGKKK